MKITRVGSSFPCGIQAINTTLGDSSATIDLGVVASYGKTFKRCIAESLIIFLCTGICLQFKTTGNVLLAIFGSKLHS